MKLLKYVFLCLAFVSQITVYASYAPYSVIEPPVKPKIASGSVQIDEMTISHYAQKYGVETEILTYIIKNESSFRADVVGDMNITCKRTGEPVRARGILQITECYYPEISDECAFDIECSLDTMLPIMKDIEKCKQQWTTCRQYFAIR